MVVTQDHFATLGFFDSHLDIYKAAKPYVCLVPLTHAPKDFPQTNIEGIRKEIPVTDVRGAEDQFTLDVQGFQLVRHSPSFDDWQNGKRVVKEYYPHITNLIKRNMGTESVYIFDHTVRLGDHVDTPDRKRQYHGLPSTMAHVDHTVASAKLHIRDDFGAKADELLKRRFQIINVWHPIKEPVEQHFLTLCDYRTVKADSFPADLIYPHISSENQLIRHSEEQKWYYASGQLITEAWMIKIVDSEAETNDSVSKFGAHTSFVVPWARPEAIPRQSIEFRAFVFYGPESSTTESQEM